MAKTGRQGSPGEEMFLPKPSDSPTVGPLRIHKRESTSPEPRATSATGQRVYSPPNNSALPPGASSSPAPLPYPDDRFPSAQRPIRNQVAPYPEHFPSAQPGRGSPTQNTSPPPNAAYADPSRTGIPEYPPSLRPREGRDGRDNQQYQSPSRLAERRGRDPPRALPDSPGPQVPDKEGLFQRMPHRTDGAAGGEPSSYASHPPSIPSVPTYPDYNKQYYPPPDASANPPSSLQIPNPGSMNRLSSTASTSTTKAQRGSPPPPETPVVTHDDIEARYAAAGIPGSSALSSLQAQNAAAAQRANQYTSQLSRGQGLAPQDHKQEHPQRPWTPTEIPGTQPHGPPTVYQGPGQATSPSQQSQTANNIPGRQVSPITRTSTSALEQDIQRLQVSGSPPPAYSSVSGRQRQGQNQNYPNEKAGHAGNIATGAAVGAAAGAVAGTALHDDPRGHPAFANDPRQRTDPSPQPGRQNSVSSHQQSNASPAPLGPGPASPPPLPEGWIAHIDPNSGQYYYIHLATSSTQWEFPKGPTPLNLNEPLSPSASVYGGNPLASPGLSSFSKPLLSPGLQPSTPGFYPSTPGYAESVMSLQSTAPTIPGYSGPPPTNGVDIYKVAPTNGVYFGPYLRYANMDMERGTWHGSILLVTDAQQPPTIHIHQSVDLSPNPRQLKASPIAHHQRWTYYRYEIDLKMEEEGSAKWTYAITSHLGCTRYEFLVAGRYETNWRFIATSGNDFSLNVGQNERSKIGGIGFMWKDIMSKHVECGGFHVQLGLGNQIYADRIWKDIPLLKQWLATSGKENRKAAPWTARHEEEVSHAYFHYYTSHFDQPYLREAFAQIPHILQIDDHDIFDGFGSYPEYMQFSNMFKNVGRIGIEMYLLFQHHTCLELLRNVSDDFDIFTITGTGWHFVKHLGPAVVVVGPDCRSERNPHQVMAGPTYQGLFPKVATLPPSVQHCIWMISVPLIYPRLEVAEQLAHTVATGKKAVTGAYNVLGRVTAGVAGVVGAKNVVGSGFDSVKRAVGKTGLMGGILSPFGDIDVMDELRDQWTHESKVRHPYQMTRP